MSAPVDVLAVMKPADHLVSSENSWRFVRRYSHPEGVGGEASLFETKCAFVSLDGHEPPPQAVVEARKLREARDAVSNLIKKVDELLSTHGEYRGYGGAGEAIEEHMRAELVLALARVKGGAA